MSHFQITCQNKSDFYSIFLIYQTSDSEIMTNFVSIWNTNVNSGLWD